jgi:hypothetical protein
MRTSPVNPTSLFVPPLVLVFVFSFWFLVLVELLAFVAVAGFFNKIKFQ